MSEDRAPRRSRIVTALRGVVVAALALALIWWFLRDVDLEALWRHVLGVRPIPLAIALLFTVAHYFLRAWRWKYLLAPLGKAPYWDMVQATVAGYAVNNLLPARGGEVVRPLILSRRTGLPFSGVLATVVLDRLLDMATVGLLFLFSLPFVLAGRETAGDVLSRPLLLLGILAGLALGAWICLKFLREPILRLGRWALSFLPERLSSRIGGMASTFFDGFSALKRGHLVAWVAAGSLAIWIDIALATYFAVIAFDIDFSLPGAFFLVGFLAVGISVPTPGGVGGYDAFGKECLRRFFGVGSDLAAGITLVMHAMAIVPITLWGLVVLWIEGIRPSRAAEEIPPASDGKMATGPADLS